MKKLLFFIFTATNIFCFSQTDNIYQKWVSKLQFNCYDTVVQNELKDVWSIEFRKNKTAEIVLFPSLTTNVQKVTKFNNQLILDYRKFIIEKITIDTLIMVENLENDCNKIIMVSMNQIYSNQKLKYTMNKLDTLYFPLKENRPQLKVNTKYNYEYEKYFQSEFTRAVLDNVKNECSIKFQFIVSKYGIVEEPKVWDSCNGKYEKIMLKIINDIKDSWIPMYIYDKTVDTFVQVKFTYK